MSLSFKEAVSLYSKDEINALASTADGYRFLLLRSLSRYEHLVELAKQCGIDTSDVGKRALFEHVYISPIGEQEIKRCIRGIFASERKVRASLEATLVGELYKMQEFNWGGLHQNSLDKTIVNNYVKKVTSYDRLNSHIENELLSSMRGYVRCSWYNHWTSIMIEDVFKEHAAVLPAVGLVKKIDFFIRDIPFDLKVTYLPEGFVKERRRQKELRPELTLLKQQSRRLGLMMDPEMSEAELLGHLWTLIADQPDESARSLAVELRAFRQGLVQEICDDPTDLIRWLYENQGERRFDASNRIFLVLVNESNFFDSWQLKRNRALIAAGIASYLDNATAAVGRDCTFEWEGQAYSAKADVVVIRHSAV